MFAKTLFDNRSNLPNYQISKGPIKKLREFAINDGNYENQKIREFLFVSHECGMIDRNFSKFTSDESLPGINDFALTLFRQGSASYKIATDESIKMTDDNRLYNMEISELCFRSAIMFDKFWAPAYSGIMLCCVARDDKENINIWNDWFKKNYFEAKNLDLSIYENTHILESMEDIKPMIDEIITSIL